MSERLVKIVSILRSWYSEYDCKTVSEEYIGTDVADTELKEGWGKNDKSIIHFQSWNGISRIWRRNVFHCTTRFDDSIFANAATANIYDMSKTLETLQYIIKT